MEIAETRGEPHLLAVAGRWWLTGVVTDALLTRHYPGVSRRDRRQSGRAGLRGRICDRRWRRRKRTPNLRSRPASGSICLASSVTNSSRNATEAVRTRLLEARAAALVRGNPARNRDRRGRRGSRNVRGARLHRGQTLRGETEGRTAPSTRQPCSPSPGRRNMKTPSRHLPSCRNPRSRSSVR